ncbi:rab effector [Labeo rohita]|uniref:Rab effector n=1 Tax=Labeo rohita TaxID=84645 RepID=A0A498N7M3_LABRO|nr:rab effector [Labeo rohita]
MCASLIQSLLNLIGPCQLTLCPAIDHDPSYPSKISRCHKWGSNSANLGAKLADPAITYVRSALKSAARSLKPAAITVPILSPKPMTTQLNQQAAAPKSSQSTTLHSNMLVVPHTKTPLTPHSSPLTSPSSRSSSSPLANTLHVDTPSQPISPTLCQPGSLMLRQPAFLTQYHPVSLTSGPQFESPTEMVTKSESPAKMAAMFEHSANMAAQQEHPAKMAAQPEHPGSEMKQELEEEGSRCLLLSKQHKFNEHCCIRCCSPFTFLLNPKRPCLDCQYNVCKSCRTYSQNERGYICGACQKSRLLRTQYLEWYYNNVKSRFKRFGSAKVLKTLYRKHIIERGALSELPEVSAHEGSNDNGSICDGSDSTLYRQSEGHSMADTLTVALRVAEEAIEEAIAKAESYRDSLVRDSSLYNILLSINSSFFHPSKYPLIRASSVLQSPDGNWIALQSSQHSRPSLLTKRKSLVFSVLEKESGVVSAYDEMGSDSDPEDQGGWGAALLQFRRHLSDETYYTDSQHDPEWTYTQHPPITSPSSGQYTNTETLNSDSETSPAPSTRARRPAHGTPQRKKGPSETHLYPPYRHPVNSATSPLLRPEVLDVNFNPRLGGDSSDGEDQSEQVKRSRRRRKSKRETSEHSRAHNALHSAATAENSAVLLNAMMMRRQESQENPVPLNYRTPDTVTPPDLLTSDAMTPEPDYQNTVAHNSSAASPPMVSQPGASKQEFSIQGPLLRGSSVNESLEQELRSKLCELVGQASERDVLSSDFEPVSDKQEDPVMEKESRVMEQNKCLKEDYDETEKPSEEKVKILSPQRSQSETGSEKQEQLETKTTRSSTTSPDNAPCGLEEPMSPSEKYSAASLCSITTEVLKVLNATEELLGEAEGKGHDSSTASTPMSSGPGNRKLDQHLTKMEENVYLAAGAVYSLEGALSDLEDCARSISSATTETELAFLEDQVATAAAQVQQSELQISDIEARISALKTAGLNVSACTRFSKYKSKPMPQTLDSSRHQRRKLPAPPIRSLSSAAASKDKPTYSSSPVSDTNLPTEEDGSSLYEA